MREFIDLLRANPAALSKFFVALVAAIGTAASVGLFDEAWAAVLISFAGAIGVYAVPNRP